MYREEGDGTALRLIVDGIVHILEVGIPVLRFRTTFTFLHTGGEGEAEGEGGARQGEELTIDS